MKKIEEEKRKKIEEYKKRMEIDYSDAGIYDGVELVESIIKIYRSYNFKTKIIAASVRNAIQVRKVAEIGVDIATIPFHVVKEMISHYKTREGMKKFLEDVVEEYKEIFK